MWDKFGGFRNPSISVNVMWIRLISHWSHDSKTTRAVLYGTQEVVAIFRDKLHTSLVSGWGNSNTGELCPCFMWSLLPKIKNLVFVQKFKEVFPFFRCRSHKAPQGCKKKKKKTEHFPCKCLQKAKGSDDMSASVLWFDILWPWGNTGEKCRGNQITTAYHDLTSDVN